jgi:uncharacterized protein with PIN domain
MDIRFLCDRNLGTLSKWLRILGYDTLYDRGNADRNFLRRAGEEGRIAITRKRLLASPSHTGRLVVVKADRADRQIGEVLRTLDLQTDPAQIMTRCLNCNEPLEEAPKETVEGQVPVYVCEKYSLFRRCPSCGGIFWPGTHRKHVEEELRRRSLDRHL